MDLTTDNLDIEDYKKVIGTLPRCQIIMLAYMFVFAVQISEAAQQKRLKKLKNVMDRNRVILEDVIDLIVGWTPKDSIETYELVVKSFVKVEPRIIDTFEETDVIHPCEMCSMLLKESREKPVCQEDYSKYKWYMC